MCLGVAAHHIPDMAVDSAVRDASQVPALRLTVCLRALPVQRVTVDVVARGAILLPVLSALRCTIYINEEGKKCSINIQSTDTSMKIFINITMIICGNRIVKAMSNV